MSKATCTWPKGDAGDPCGRQAVAVYIVRGERYLRCKTHDSKAAQNTADDRGYLRVAL